MLSANDFKAVTPEKAGTYQHCVDQHMATTLHGTLQESAFRPPYLGDTTGIIKKPSAHRIAIIHHEALSAKTQSNSVRLLSFIFAPAIYVRDTIISPIMSLFKSLAAIRDQRTDPDPYSLAPNNERKLNQYFLSDTFYLKSRPNLMLGYIVNKINMAKNRGASRAWLQTLESYHQALTIEEGYVPEALKFYFENEWTTLRYEWHIEKQNKFALDTEQKLEKLEALELDLMTIAVITGYENILANDFKNRSVLLEQTSRSPVLSITETQKPEESKYERIYPLLEEMEGWVPEEQDYIIESEKLNAGSILLFSQLSQLPSVPTELPAADTSRPASNPTQASEPAASERTLLLA